MQLCRQNKDYRSSELHCGSSSPLTPEAQSLTSTSFTPSLSTPSSYYYEKTN